MSFAAGRFEDEQWLTNARDDLVTEQISSRHDDVTEFTQAVGPFRSYRRTVRLDVTRSGCSSRKPNTRSWSPGSAGSSGRS